MYACCKRVEKSKKNGDDQAGEKPEAVWQWVSGARVPAGRVPLSHRQMCCVVTFHDLKCKILCVQAKETWKTYVG